MMNRRRFVSAFGVSTLFPAARALPHPFEADASRTSRTRISLNGDWERYIDAELYDVVQIPSSQRPLGSHHLKRSFLLPGLSSRERAILHFDAITYFGRASVNGANLGTMSL